MASDEVRATTLRLPEGLHRRFKLVLVAEGKTAQEVWQDYVRRYVEAKEKR